MKQFVYGIEGVDGYLIFSMLVFILFFLALLAWVLFTDQRKIDAVKKLPLE
jgi:cbb3-type cytochrome oxidase subunit 3